MPRPEWAPRLGRSEKVPAHARHKHAVARPVEALPGRGGVGTSPLVVRVHAAVGALDGKTAIVTGASSGIGAATAAVLAREGARVAGGARRVERLETELKLELDVTDPNSCEAFVDA